LALRHSPLSDSIEILLSEEKEDAREGVGRVGDGEARVGDRHDRRRFIGHGERIVGVVTVGVEVEDSVERMEMYNGGVVDMLIGSVRLFAEVEKDEDEGKKNCYVCCACSNRSTVESRSICRRVRPLLSI
jgi:hypothetical protein